MSHVCPHCGKPINPAKMLGKVKSPRKEAAAKANGERLRRMYANAKKLETGDRRAPELQREPTVDLEIGQYPRQPEDVLVSPRPTTLAAKKAAAMAALAGMGKKSLAPDLLEPALNDIPRAPFDLNLEGEPHRVTQFGKRLGLCYIGAGEPVFARYLELGEMERFWEQRIK